MSKKPVILITGCSSGIGAELAKQFYVDERYRVVATCRAHSLQKLREQFIENDRFEVHELDVTVDQDIYSLVNNICCKWGRIDGVINNAAVCYRGVVEHMDSDSELIQIKTNYLGPMTLIRAVLPIMREQRSGHIINVSSSSCSLPMPTMSSYSASKHALAGATEALWYETRPFGILVNLVELGFVKSESYKNVVVPRKAKLSSLLSGPYSEFYQSMSPFVETAMRLSLSSPSRIASRIIRVLESNDSRLKIYVTLDAITFNVLRRCLPSHWLNLIFYRLLPGSPKWGGHWRKAPL